MTASRRLPRAPADERRSPATGLSLPADFRRWDGLNVFEPLDQRLPNLVKGAGIEKRIYYLENYV